MVHLQEPIVGMLGSGNCSKLLKLCAFRGFHNRLAENSSGDLRARADGASVALARTLSMKIGAASTAAPSVEQTTPGDHFGAA